MKDIESQFEHNRIPEWEEFYLDIQKLHLIIRPFKLRKNEINLLDLEFGIDYNLNKQIKEIYETSKDLLPELITYSNEFISELNRIYIFVTENVKYYIKRQEKITSQLNFIKSSKEPAQFSEQKHQLENAIKELYKEINLMRGFIKINYEAEKVIRNKMKEYCQVIFNQEEFISVLSNIDNYSLEFLMNDHKIDQIISEIETIYLTMFYKENNLQSKKILHSYLNRNNDLTGKQFFLFGLFCGVFSLIVFVIISISVRFGIDMDTDPEFNLIYPMFRGQINICIYLWVWAVNVYLWDKYSVNYRLIFKFDNHFSNFVTLLKRATAFSAIISLSILYYITIRTKTSDIIESFSYIPIRMSPVIGWVSFLVYLLWPFDGFNLKGRRFLFYHIKRILLNIEIESVSFFIISQIGSMAGIIRDFCYSFCYYYNYNQEYLNGERVCDPISMPLVIISLFPAIIISLIMILKFSYYYGDIFLNSINILKSFFSISTVVMALTIKNDENYWIIWAVSACWTAIHGFYWDAKLDWGLLSTTSNNILLRDKLALKQKWIYYIFLILDLILRFLWVLIISPDVVYKSLRPEFVFTILYWGEAFRRFFSNFLVIEYEHITICNNFRATQAIELPFTKNEKDEFVIKDEKVKEYNMERDKINERLRKIVDKTFFDSDSKWIEGKYYIKRLDEMDLKNKLLE